MYSSGACWVSALPAFAFFSQPRLGALEAQQVELRRVVDAHQDTLDANLDHRVSHNSGVRSLPLSHSPFFSRRTFFLLSAMDLYLQALWRIGNIELDTLVVAFASAFSHSREAASGTSSEHLKALSYFLRKGNLWHFVFGSD